MSTISANRIVRTKVCGITRLDDALAAAAAGVDVLGFMFYPDSKRAITAHGAAAIIRKLPSTVETAGVFVDAAEAAIRETIGVTGINILQFHGQEPPEFCVRFTAHTVWKAFRIRDRRSLESIRDYSRVNAWLLDSYVPDQRGGTGAVFNWDLAVEAKSLGHPVILAGGLTPDNVAQAVLRVRPFGVDVSSGVESTPGLKDHQKIRAFIAAVRQAEAP